VSRRLTFLLGAFEALFVIAVTIGGVLLPLSLVWLVENDPSVSWITTFKTSVDIWFVAHGTTLTVPAGHIAGLATPTFFVHFLPLGASLGLALFASRIGRRLTRGNELWPGWFAVGLVYLAVSFGLAAAARDKHIWPITWQATYLPAILFTGIVIASSLIRGVALDRAGDDAPREAAALNQWLKSTAERVHWSIRAIWSPAWRAASGAVAMLLGFSALVIAALVALNWIDVIRLYEALQVSLLGGLVLTIAQLALLPNLTVWVFSWFTGVGFHIGSGSSISPLGTQTGPVPVLPILGALPVGDFAFGTIAVVVPLLATFFATILVRRHAEAVRWEFASPLSAALTLGIAIGAIAAAEGGILGVFATGSLGPGRLQDIGVNPLMLALVLFLEVTPVAVATAFYTAKPEADVLNRRADKLD
jgi:hypothetical protein